MPSHKRIVPNWYKVKKPLCLTRFAIRVVFINLSRVFFTRGCS